MASTVRGSITDLRIPIGMHYHDCLHLRQVEDAARYDAYCHQSHQQQRIQIQRKSEKLTNRQIQFLRLNLKISEVIPNQYQYQQHEQHDQQQKQL